MKKYAIPLKTKEKSTENGCFLCFSWSECKERSDGIASMRASKTPYAEHTSRIVARSNKKDRRSAWRIDFYISIQRPRTVF